MQPPLPGRFELVGDAQDAARERFGDHEAYVEGERRLTFDQWLRAADGLAAGLAERGVRPGDVVAIMLPSSIDYAIAYAAITRLGAVASGLNTRLGPREVAAIFQRSSPALAIVDESLGMTGRPDEVPVLTRADMPSACAGDGLGARRQRGNSTDPTVIIWTSGTTGVPKGAWFDHRNLEAAVHTAGVMTEPFDRRLVTTPFAHAGYMAKQWEQLAWGTTLVIGVLPWTVDSMVAQLKQERINVAGAVPTQWAKVASYPDLDRREVANLRLCISATAPMPPDLVERLTGRLGCPVVVRYAMTESPSISGTDPGDPPHLLYRTVGRPQAGVELRLTDTAGEPVPTGSVGRISLRGPCVMRGYWGAPELTAEVLTPDGWLHSGDLGRLDDDGHLTIVGRTGDMYIRGGYNVYPLEVENVLAEHPSVDQVAVIGLPTAVIGEIGVAFVVAAPGATITLEELRIWCKARLADYKAPDRLELVDHLPVTAMMKVDKAALRAGLSP